MEKRSAKSKGLKKTSAKKAAVKKTVVQKKTKKKPSSAQKDVPEELSRQAAEKPESQAKARVPVEVAQDVAPQTEPGPSSLYASQEQNIWQDKYGDNRIVLMIRDPYWCFVYWDISADRQAEIAKEVENASARKILRVYDVTDIQFDGLNAHRTMDIELSAEATNWYVNVWAADRAFCIDLGLLYADGRFVTFARSNVVTTPRDAVSSLVDEEWMVVDETFDRLYQTAGAADPGRSSEMMMKYMLKRVRADVTSGGLASMGSQGGRPKAVFPEDFWMVVNTELILYGATEPDAAVTIQGQPLHLNQDGTFSVRYALPDGKQTIAVQAVNANGTQERKITPVIEKHTE